MTTASYARCSTAQQTTQQQLDRLRVAAPGAVEYVDEGISGKTEDRPALRKLEVAIVSGQVREVYVCKIDRLGRSAKGILEFFDLAERHGVRVVVTDQGVDTSTPIGKVVRTILAALAELETDLIRERTKAAMDAFKVGTRVPKGRVGRKPIVTPELVTQIRALREERQLEWSAIARTVHHPSSSCRKWYSTSRAGTLRVINPLKGFPPPSAAPAALEGLPPRPERDSSSHAPSREVE